MCGRYTLTTPNERLAEAFDLVDMPDLTPRYNIAPTQDGAVVRAEGGSRTLVLLRWGLVPGWADDPAIGNRMINARAETAASKPAFRSAFRRRRCLVPADGFYEWQKLDKRKQPFCIRRPDEGPFAFAGLWEQRQGSDGTEIESYTILTTEPNAVLRPLHNRMPVVLSPEVYELWLDPEVQEVGKLKPLLRPPPDEELVAFPVSLRVNSPSNDDPACIRPVDGVG